MAIRISGDRQLKTLAGQSTRPTPSRVREAIFNIWQGRIEGARWLDLCTGSGAMAAEALLHGASVVVGIEQSAAACKLIGQNCQSLVTANQSFQIYRGDVVKMLSKLSPHQFDLAYFDPPYHSDLYEPVLATIAPLLAPNAMIAVEHERNRQLPAQITELVVCDRRRYGQTALTFYERVCLE